MISFSLFWLAIPLAILGAIALRLTVALYRGIVPSVTQVPERAERLEPERMPRPTPVVVASEGGTDITVQAPVREQRFTSEAPGGLATQDELTEEAEPGPMTIPAFKMAFAALAIVFFGTAFLTALVRMVMMAVVAILQGKGMLGPGSPDAFYLSIEVALLPVGFVLFARLLQDLLPTTFVNACLVAAWWLLTFLVYALFLILLYAVFTAFFGWFFRVLQPSASTALLLVCPVCVRAFFALDFPGRRGIIASR